MKKKTLIIYLLFVLIGLTAKAQVDQENLFEKKIKNYQKMKKNGLTMGVIGGVSSFFGVILVNQAEWKKETTSSNVNYTTNDGSGIVGIVLLVVGIPLTITGAILGSIGIKKVKEYTRKLDDLSLRVSVTPQMTGFKLTFNF